MLSARRRVGRAHRRSHINDMAGTAHPMNDKKRTAFFLMEGGAFLILQHCIQ